MELDLKRFIRIKINILDLIIKACLLQLKNNNK